MRYNSRQYKCLTGNINSISFNIISISFNISSTLVKGTIELFQWRIHYY